MWQAGPDDDQGRRPSAGRTENRTRSVREARGNPQGGVPRRPVQGGPQSQDGADGGWSTSRQAGAAPYDPRSKTTGKKVRRMETGPIDSPRRGENGSLAARGPAGGGRPGNSASASPSALGSPLGSVGQPGAGGDRSSPPGRGQRVPGPPAAGSGGGLPPLTHTGEVPSQPGRPSETVVMNGLATPPNEAGVFEDSGRPGSAGPGAPNNSPGRHTAPGGRPRRDPFADSTTSTPSGKTGDGAPPAGRGVAAPAAAITAARLGKPGGEPLSGRPVGRTRSGGADPFDQPNEPGRPSQRPAGARPARRNLSDPADRLQDTEFKLAAHRRKPKPKEPNKLILIGVIVLVMVIGGITALLVTGGDDEGASDIDQEAIGEPDPNDVGEEVPADLVDEEAPDAGEQFVGEPTLQFEEAEVGPLLTDTTYSIELLGQPTGSQVQVVVDDLPQEQPTEFVPDLKLPAGRHTIFLQIIDASGETTNTNSVEMYVLDELPAAGWRVNLKSVDMVNEGWPEAIRQYDEFRALGHDSLKILPLTDGFWNLFVADFGPDVAPAEEYCESFELAQPDECFPVLFDPATAPNPEAGAALPGDGAADVPPATEPVDDGTDTPPATEPVDDGGEGLTGDGGSTADESSSDGASDGG